jgi:hypothetical protein
MRRASTTPTLAIAICLSLGALVPAAPAAAALEAPSILGILEFIDRGLTRVWSWIPTPGNSQESVYLPTGNHTDPNGCGMPGNPTCPSAAPPPEMSLDEKQADQH